MPQGKKKAKARADLSFPSGSGKLAPAVTPSPSSKAAKATRSGAAGSASAAPSKCPPKSSQKWLLDPAAVLASKAAAAPGRVGVGLGASRPLAAAGAMDPLTTSMAALSLTRAAAAATAPTHLRVQIAPDGSPTGDALAPHPYQARAHPMTMRRGGWGYGGWVRVQWSSDASAAHGLPEDAVALQVFPSTEVDEHALGVQPEVVGRAGYPEADAGDDGNDPPPTAAAALPSVQVVPLRVNVLPPQTQIEVFDDTVEAAALDPTLLPWVRRQLRRITMVWSGMLLYRAVQPHPAQPAQPAVRPVEVLLPTELGDDVYRLVDGQFTVVLGDDALHPDDAKPSDLSAPPPSPPRPLPSADTLSWALPEFHGYPEQVQQLHRLLHDFVYEAALYRRHHQRPLAGALLHGPSGIGKTLLAHDLLSASFPQTPVVRIHAASWLAKGPSEIMNHLTNLYTRGAPTSDPRLPAQIVVIDGIDLFCGNRRQMDAAQGGAAHPQLIQMMLTLLDGMHQKSAPASHALRTFTLAICQKPEMLDDALRRPGRFDIEIELNVPTPQDRAAILAHHVQTLLGPSDDAGSSGEETASAWRADVAEMAKRAHGFIGADLAAVAAEARRSLESSVDETASSPPDATVAAAPWPQAAAALRRALKRIRPSALRDISLEIPEVHWSDIGGLEDIKQRFHEAVTWPMAHPEAFQRMRLQPTKGILLYGPPGCSKTLLAKALATEAGLNFLVVKGPELFSKWVGESEKAVQQLFARARAASPAIIFFDEIDAIATARAGGDGGGGVHDRVLSQLLTEMDGIETLSRVLVVAATNRPDRLDAALLRPGRIDRMLYVGLPEPAARSAIFRIACKRMAVTADIDWSRLTDQTEGYTGAEIVALCHEAAMEALRAGAMAVAALHFEGALSRVLPRTTPEMLAFFERFQAGL